MDNKKISNITLGNSKDKDKKDLELFANEILAIDLENIDDEPEETKERSPSLALIDGKKNKSESSITNKSSDREIDFKQHPLPDKMEIGFQSGIKKKEIVQFLRSKHGWANSTTAMYNISSFDGGYIYELQDGPGCRSVMRSLKEALKEGKKPVIPTGGKRIKVSMGSGHRLSAKVLGSASNEEVSEYIRFEGKMQPLADQGEGLFKAGAVLAVVGLVSVILSTVVKFVLIDEAKIAYYKPTNIELPFVQIEKLIAATSEDSYIPRLEYRANRWSYSPEIKPIPNIDPSGGVDSLILGESFNDSVKDAESVLNQGKVSK